MHTAPVSPSYADCSDRIHARIARSDQACYAAWQQIARSYRRIMARPPIAGAADTELRDDIRARLREGTLPRVNGRAWAGKGTGATCVCCRQAIARHDAQYEPQVAGELRSHASCYTIWLAESIALNGLERGRSGN